MGRRIGSLFSGAGGLDLAVQEVFGGDVVWHAEIDKAASKVLAYRFPGVPNLGDISAVDWAEVPAVDVLCGGFPCQDVSSAGKRAGIKAGTRSGLWSVFADAIDALRPRWVVIENVRGLLSATAHRTVDDADGDVEPSAGAVGDGAGRPVLRAAGAVLGDLADLGYDAQWATVAAADVGAPHRRERVFILATDASRRELQRRGISGAVADSAGRGAEASEQRQRYGNALVSSGAVAADLPRNGRDEGRPEPARLVGGFDAAVSGDGHGVALLPTPRATDPAGAHSRSSDGFRPQLGEVVRQLGESENVVSGEDDGAVPVLPTDGGGDDTLSIALNGDGVAVDVSGCVDGHNAFVPVELAGTKPEPRVALLPTPCVVDRLATGEMTLEEWDESRRSQKERGVGSFGPRGDSLGAAILRVEEGSERPDYSTTKSRRGGDEPGVALLPTPQRRDGEAGASKTVGGIRPSGQPRQKDLNTVTVRELGVERGLEPVEIINGEDDGAGTKPEPQVALLPTPTAQAAKHGAESRFGGGNGDVSNLWQIAHLLPTPASADGHRGQDFARANRERSGGDDLVTLAVKADRDSAWGKYEPAIRRWQSIVGPPPAPTEPNKNGNPRLSAAFSEWLMGWPQGWVTHPDIGISRNDQLRIIGNGVCPQQAIASLHFLLAVASGTHTHTLGRADMTELLPTPTSRDHKGPNQRGDTTCLHGAINSEVGE